MPQSIGYAFPKRDSTPGKSNASEERTRFLGARSARLFRLAGVYMDNVGNSLARTYSR